MVQSLIEWVFQITLLNMVMWMNLLQEIDLTAEAAVKRIKRIASKKTKKGMKI